MGNNFQHFQLVPKQTYLLSLQIYLGMDHYIFEERVG